MPETKAMQHVVQSGEAVPASGDSPSKGPIYRCPDAKDGFATLEGASTAWELFQRAVEKYPDNNFLGRRSVVDGKAGDYVWLTYRHADEKVKQLGSAYRSVGLTAKGKVGIYGANCPEWFLAMEACNAQSLYCVPIYDTLGADAVEFIINHSEASVCVAQASKLPGLLKALPNCPNVTTVVSMSALDDESRKAVQGLGKEAYSWEEFLTKGKESPADPVPPLPTDLCTIMYTSGTTGEPKGVLLTHSALLSVIAGLNQYCKTQNLIFNEKDVFISYLPLAHIFDRVGEEFFTYHGASIGYWQGDVKALTDDIAALRPTVFCAVPRILDRIYSGVNAKVASGSPIAKFLYNFFYARKLDRLKHGVPQDNAAPLADHIVFHKIRDRLGGRVRLILSGAAPLAPHVEEFLKVTMCCPVVQGYGLTETNSGLAITYVDNWEQRGTVGPPLACLEVRLESVPEMNYDALGTPARGEVCVRGPGLFSGYMKREDLTKEVLDEEGWFHSGDVGEWQPDGSLKIIDRKKNIFKLSQGEYVAVENLENTYGNCSVVDQVWVYGNSFESVLVAVAVPNEIELLKWAKGAGVEGDLDALCATEDAKKFILGQLTEVGKKGKLKGFEMIKAVHLESKPFDLERDLLTPTFKKKRPQLLKYFKEQVDAMYKNLKSV